MRPRFNYSTGVYSGQSDAMKMAKRMLAMKGTPHLALPMSCGIHFFFERPKKHFKPNGKLRKGATAYVTKKPDIRIGLNNLNWLNESNESSMNPAAADDNGVPSQPYFTVPAFLNVMD